ncbi:MAG: HEAT repeat domain-containing protein [Myxococcales bacterium]|nr:HEAT repeat domain-containing protein [Myxococcales bacterium]MCB9708929.1 HEAT repeat domain-containing protein [Myxococcales bacterium]
MVSNPSRPPLATPLSLHAAAERLARSRDREEIMEVLAKYGSQFFDFLAIFAVHQGIAHGKISAGPDTLSQGLIGRSSIDLNAPLVFRELLRDLKPKIIDLNLSEATRNAVEHFPRLDFQPALFIPIHVRRRVVLLVYGDRGGHDLSLDSFSKLLAFGAHVGNALEALILRRKLQTSIYPTQVQETDTSPRGPDPEPSPGDTLTDGEAPVEIQDPLAAEAPRSKEPSSAELFYREPFLRPSFDRVESLVRELASCSPEEVDATIAIALTEGPAVLPELVKRFPGTLWFNRHQKYARVARGRDVSAVARALVAFGTHADPYVIALLDPTSDDEARYYAVLVAADLGHPSLIAPLARLLFDHDAGVRTVSLDVLVGFREATELEWFLRPIRAVAQSASEAPARRRTAVRALGELHDAKAAKLLISLLGTDEPALVQAAVRALVLITRQDFGTSRRRWATWYARHGRKSRVLWLIDALSNDNESLRSAAFDELLQKTGHTFGFTPTLAKKERKAIQKKFKKHFQL